MKRKHKPTWDFQLKGAKRAEVLIYGDIGDAYYGGGTSKAFIEQLNALGDLDDLDVRLNSRGGLVFEGFAMYEALRMHKAKVHIKIDGIAASICSVIAMAGDDIEIAPNGFMMIHRAWNFAGGTADDFEAQMKALRLMDNRITEVYLTQAKQSKDEIWNALKAETWMDADECLKLGYVDAISEQAADEKAMAAVRSMNLSIFKNAPQALAPAPGTVIEPDDLSEMARAHQEELAMAIRLRILELDEPA